MFGFYYPRRVYHSPWGPLMVCYWAMDGCPAGPSTCKPLFHPATRITTTGSASPTSRISHTHFKNRASGERREHPAGEQTIQQGNRDSDSQRTRSTAAGEQNHLQRIEQAYLTTAERTGHQTGREQSILGREQNCFQQREQAFKLRMNSSSRLV